MTRQATRRVVPNENTDLDFTMTPAEGNDDAGVSDDESDEPYAAPFGTVGKLYIEDIPSTYFSDLTGNDNDEKSYKMWCRDFARLQIGLKWYRVSAYAEWRFYGFLKKVNGKWNAHPDNADLFEPNNTDRPTPP